MLRLLALVVRIEGRPEMEKIYVTSSDGLERAKATKPVDAWLADNKWPIVAAALCAANWEHKLTVNGRVAATTKRIDS